jgi:FkbM family methyltransferase
MLSRSLGQKVWGRLRWEFWQWVYRRGYELLPVVPPFVTQRHLVRKDRPWIILDVGAHTGETACEYERYFPGANIHSFEPIPTLCQQCRENPRRQLGWQAHALALADRVGVSDFFVRQWDYSSSLMHNAPYLAQVDLQELMEEVSVLKVPTSTVDVFCAEQAIDYISILKLDIQGAELAALRGAEAMLQRQAIELIYCEVEFRELYAGQALYHEIADYLAVHGYQLWNFYNLVRTRDQLVYADAIFVPSYKLKPT